PERALMVMVSTPDSNGNVTVSERVPAQVHEGIPQFCPPNDREIGIVWQGVTYWFKRDASSQGGILRLPNGTLLRCQGWSRSGPREALNVREWVVAERRIAG